MDFKIFEEKLLNELEKHKCKKCIKIINNNETLIKNNFGNDENSKILNEFIEKFNNIIININNNRSEKYYKIFEIVLNHEFFANVLSEFRNSTIFVKACKKKKVELIKWLLTMKINYCVKDEYERTALMYLSRIPILFFAVKKILKDKNTPELLECTDNQGKTAIYYAAANPRAATEIMKAGCNLDHKDNDGNTVLNYCCKNEIFLSFIPILCNNDKSINDLNNEGKNAMIYLAEQGNAWELKHLSKRPIDINFRNENNEGVVTTLIKQIYQPDQRRHPNFYIPYYVTMRTIVDRGFDLNIAIDDEGNTPLMFFIMIEDFCTVYYMLKYYKNLDLSLQNKNGDDAFSLCLRHKNDYLNEFFFKNESLNLKYNDQLDNNILIYFIISNNNKMIRLALHRNNNLVNQVNAKKETPIIIASKLGRTEIVKTLARFNADVNHQDYLGNTALYYAVDLRYSYLISILIYYKADPHLKNNRGKSAWDLVNTLPKNENLLKAFSQPSELSSVVKQNSFINNSYIHIYDFDNQAKRKGFFTEAINQIVPKNLKNIFTDKDENKDNNYRKLANLKYQNTIEFDFGNYENRYKPLPNADVIRAIEFDIYEFNNKKKKHTKITGIPMELYYRRMIFGSLNLLFGSAFLSIA